MSKKPYRKGYLFELRVKKHFEQLGAYTIRSAKSHGVYDIIAIKNGIVYGIQCKTNGRLNSHSKHLMLSLYEKHKILPVLAFSDNRKLILIDLRNGKPLSEL